jgi:bifunctional non-homologous end joining protein LigD
MLPAGFVAPCLPTKAAMPASGELWLHEIKHDGFRVIGRKDGERVRLYSRPGNDLTPRFPLIVQAMARLRSRSCTIDGEAVACGDDGVPSFDRLRHRRHDGSVFLYVFDLIELDGDDLRREPLEVRKTTLASVLAKAAPGLRLNQHIEHADGETVFRHACKLGLEGIVSNRKGLPYRSGRSPDWLKMKNPACAAVKREAEEDWGAMSSHPLVLKRASVSRSSGEWSTDDYDVVCEGLVVGRIMNRRLRRKPRRGSGAPPTATTMTARRRTVTPPRARPLWLTSRRAGCESREPRGENTDQQATDASTTTTSARIAGSSSPRSMRLAS